MAASTVSMTCHKSRARVVVHLTGEGDLGAQAHYHSTLLIAAHIPGEKSICKTSHFCYVNIIPVFGTLIGMGLFHWSNISSTYKKPHMIILNF